jgi:hypothetical protein
MQYSRAAAKVQSHRNISSLLKTAVVFLLCLSAIKPSCQGQGRPSAPRVYQRAPAWLDGRLWLWHALYYYVVEQRGKPEHMFPPSPSAE